MLIAQLSECIVDLKNVANNYVKLDHLLQCNVVCIPPTIGK
jgi:hypothetical protein